MSGKPTHGQSKTLTYRIWASMIQRCVNPKCPEYENYGGRGIEVCPLWMTFRDFLADMGEKPHGLTLGRINNERGYSPRNCRWETYSEQNKNRRSWDRRAAFAKGRNKHHNTSP